MRTRARHSNADTAVDSQLYVVKIRKVFKKSGHERGYCHPLRVWKVDEQYQALPTHSNEFELFSWFAC
jgi:hypothetical protein